MDHRAKQRLRRALFLFWLVAFLAGDSYAWNGVSLILAAPVATSVTEKASAVDRLFSTFITEDEPGAAVMRRARRSGWRHSWLPMARRLRWGAGRFDRV